MSRIARATYSKKIESALTNFKASPEPAVKVVNAALFQEFGGYMNLADIYLCREIARTGGGLDEFFKAQTTAKVAAKANKAMSDSVEKVHDVPTAEPIAQTAEPVQESAGLV